MQKDQTETIISVPIIILHQCKHPLFVYRLVSDWTIESNEFVENSKNEKLYRVEFKSDINKRYVFYNENGKEERSTATL